MNIYYSVPRGSWTSVFCLSKTNCQYLTAFHLGKWQYHMVLNLIGCMRCRHFKVNLRVRQLATVIQKEFTKGACTHKPETLSWAFGFSLHLGPGERKLKFKSPRDERCQRLAKYILVTCWVAWMYALIFSCVFSAFEMELLNTRIRVLIALFITHCNVYSKDFSNVTNITADF